MLCKDCGILEKKIGPRCLVCHRKWRAEHARKLRKRNQITLLQANKTLAKHNRRICARCLRKCWLSEFSTSMGNGKGKINKICDRCLTQMYDHPNRKLDVIDYGFWRRRAYSLNSVSKSKLQRELLRKVKLNELSYIFRPQDIQGLYVRQEGCCFYCKVQLAPETISIDHVIPRSRNGSNTPDNIVITCVDCNTLKATRTGLEFLSFINGYAQRFIKVTEPLDKEPKG